MYTPPLEAHSPRLTSAASAEKSGDNGFKDLLHDKYLTDRAERSRDDAPRTRETRTDDARTDTTRPRDTRHEPSEEPRDAEPRGNADIRTDEKATPEKPAVQDNKPSARQESKPDETNNQTETVPEQDGAAAAPAEPPAIQTETPDVQSSTITGAITGIVPDNQAILDGMENTGTPAANSASAAALATPAVDDGLALLTTPEGQEEITAGNSSVAAILDATADQRATAPQTTASTNTVQPATAPTAAVADINPTAIDTAVTTANTASTPLAAVAKPGAGARTESGQAAASPQTTPAATNVPATASAGDVDGDFESVLTTTQGANSGAGQTGAAAAATASNPGSAEMATIPNKAAEAMAAADDTLPRGAEPLPQATASNGANSPSPTAGIGNELRLVSGASPLTETAAARNLPNAATNQLAVQINRAVVDGQDKIVINLKPGTLGRVSVNLEVGHDNRIIAVISAEKADTLDLLQRDARALERALQEAGLKTDSGSLSFNLQGGQGDSPFDDFSDDGPFAALPLSDEDADGPNANPTNAYASSASGVDIHV